MIEDLEFSISQYLDGTLTAAEKAELEQRLAEDGQARALLEEYRKLDSVVRISAGDLPAINWDALARNISGNIGRDEPESFKIGPAAWMNRGRWLAVAASLLIAAGIGVELLRSKTNQVNINPSPGPMAVATAEVSGPQVEAPRGPVVAEVTIGTSVAMEDGMDDQNSGGVVKQPSHVSIASAAVPVDRIFTPR